MKIPAYIESDTLAKLQNLYKPPIGWKWAINVGLHTDPSVWTMLGTKHVINAIVVLNDGEEYVWCEAGQGFGDDEKAWADAAENLFSMMLQNNSIQWAVVPRIVATQNKRLGQSQELVPMSGSAPKIISIPSIPPIPPPTNVYFPVNPEGTKPYTPPLVKDVKHPDNLALQDDGITKTETPRDMGAPPSTIQLPQAVIKGIAVPIYPTNFLPFKENGIKRARFKVKSWFFTPTFKAGEKLKSKGKLIEILDYSPDKVNDKLVITYRVEDDPEAVKEANVGGSAIILGVLVLGGIALIAVSLESIEEIVNTPAGQAALISGSIIALIIAVVIVVAGIRYLRKQAATA